MLKTAPYASDNWFIWINSCSVTSLLWEARFFVFNSIYLFSIKAIRARDINKLSYLARNAGITCYVKKVGIM